MRPLSSHNARAPLSQLRIKRGVEGKFAVWSRFCCLYVFDSFAEAAEYVKWSCCYEKDKRA